MKKQLIDLIEKLEIRLNRQMGGWGLAIPTENNPSQADIKTIKENRQEIIDILQEQRQEELAEKRKLKEEKDIVVEWREGSPLSGYAVRDNIDTMLELGLAKPVSGWGYLVKADVIEALGTEFTVAEARAYVDNQKEEKTEVAEEKSLESLKETAKQLGHKVKIKSYSTKCNGDKLDCDLDIITEYVDGKGNITKTRVHTH